MRKPSSKHFASRSRRSTGAILLVFALFSVLNITISIWATKRPAHGAAVDEAAARQRMLAVSYVEQVLLARAGRNADPASAADLLDRSARALISGGVVPASNGDDDKAKIGPATGATVMAQLKEEQRLVADLIATGTAILSHRAVATAPLTGREHIATTDPVERLLVIADLTSNVSLNASHTIARRADQSVSDLITLQLVFGAAGLAMSILLAWVLVAVTRRQTAHFRALVTSSTDLVLVFGGGGGCRYASPSVLDMAGGAEVDLLGEGLVDHVHAEDRASVRAATTHAEPSEIVFRMMNTFGEWRYLEAHVTDLRADRHVRGIVLNARDVTERVALEEELTRQAFHDSLTGLANRALFRDRLDQALARSARSREPLAVLIVDLDGFKNVNDSLGHDAGDKLLQIVAERFSAAIRPGDTLARLGGDEFGLLLEGVSEPGAVGIARRLLESLSEPVVVGDRQFTLTTSVGIVLHTGGHGTSDELVRHADLAMYAAKGAGRGLYEVFRYEMARELGEALGIEHDLRLALARGELSLDFQTEVDLNSNGLLGCEALLRWRSPTRGNVIPDEFIPVAEATGLILPIGELVLREACRQTAVWCREGLLPENFVTWVNVSGKQLSAGGLVAVVRQALTAAELSPVRLGLEVTETAMVGQGAVGERARAELEALRAEGVRIALDDFGTGLSTLAQLRSFPVDMIKIDLSFIQGAEHDAKDAAIVAGLANLAREIGIVTVAEGIETHQQLGSMRKLGCDLGQGFIFARPVSADEMSYVLRKYSRSADALPYAASA